MTSASSTEPPYSDEEEEGKLIPAPPGPDDASFVGRLQQRFGEEIDPEISLQDDDSELPSEGESPRSDSNPSSETEGLLLKLSEKDPHAKRYRVKGELARGGMGAILRVWDEDLRRNLAMKVLLSRGGADDLTEEPAQVDQELLSRFLEEAQITGQLDHPGIVPVHDLGIDERGRVYFTMRLVRGRDLKAILDLLAESREGWTLTKALHVVLKVCEAMAFAHSKGVVHRDLKPANIMVGRFGETCVMDWGLARVLGRRDSHDLRLKPADASALSLVRTARRSDGKDDPKSPLVTMDGDIIGTPSYMSPEQAEGRLEDVGPRSDVYSVGSILYQILTGHAPYVKPGAKLSPHTVLLGVIEGPPTPIHKINPNVPGELIAICDKAMARDPEQRYPTMLEMAADIEAFLEGRVVTAYEAGPLAEGRKWIQRNRGLSWAISIALLLAIGGVAGVIAVQTTKATQLFEANEGLQMAKKVAEDKEQEAAAAALAASAAAAKASLAQQRAEESEVAAKGESYRANIRAAEYTLQLRRVREALALLSTCDEELRDWEWRHLDLWAQSQLGTPVYPTTPLRALVVADRARVLALPDNGVLGIYEANTGGLTGRHVASKRLWPLRSPEHLDFDLDPEREIAAVIGRRPGRVVLLDAAGYDADTPADPQALFHPYELAEGDGGYLPPNDVEVALAADAEPTCLAFGPSDDLLAVGYDNGAVLLWDFASRDLVVGFEGGEHGARVHALAWSADGAHLAAADGAGTVRTFDWVEGVVDGEIAAHEGAALALAYSPDAAVLATAGQDARVRLWDCASGAQLARHDGHDGPVRTLAYHPAGRVLISAGDDTTLQVWNLARTPLQAVAPGAVAVASKDALRTLFGHEGSIAEVRFSADGALLYSAGRDGSLRAWDPEFAGPVTELVDARFTRPDSPLRLAQVTAVDFAPDGLRCLTGHADGSLALWDSVGAELIDVLRGHQHAITSAVFGPRGETILSASIDKTAILWEIASRRERFRFEHSKRVNSAVIAPDGTYVVTACGDEAVHVFQTSTGDELLLEGHGGWVNAVVVSPDGTRIWSGSRAPRAEAATLRSWSVETGEELNAVAFGAEVGRLAISADGALLAAGLGDGRLVVLETESGAEVFTHELSDAGDPVTALAFNRAGTRVLAGSVDGLLRVYHARTGDHLLTLQGHAGSISSIAFSADDARLLSGSAVLGSGADFVRPGESVARIWETGTVAERRTARRNAAELRRIATTFVDQAYEAVFLQERVLANLNQNPLMTSDVRPVALRLARLRTVDGKALAAESLRVVLDPESGSKAFDLARRRAEAAAAIASDSELVLAVLAATQVRAGLFPAALQSISALRGVAPRARDARAAAIGNAFAALAHDALGHAEEARAAYEAFAASPLVESEEFAGLRAELDARFAPLADALDVE